MPAKILSLYKATYLGKTKILSAEELDALIQQWRAKDPTRLIMIRTIEQSAMSMERMMYAQSKKIQGLMQSVHVARDFCERAGISVLATSTLPYWFFLDDGDDEKKRALQIARIYDEANDLKSYYSDQVIAQVKDTYPRLYAYVLNGYKEGSSFVGALGDRYQQSVPTINLVKLMNELKEKFPHHFTWAQDPQRYQIIIDGLRAEQMEQAMDLEKTNRYATNIQNRITKGVATLAAIDQHEHQLKVQDQLIEPPSSPALPVPGDASED